ncbi:entericidin A/B family lipoprotein [Accumulibacter sp.]|nr:entericidin A/B family lipoprotein [Accumulibacter sp.]HRF04825.1 entericidin A/B family lipoprotein [Accumulibacter sp.]
MKRLILLSAALLAIVSLSACNTMQGVGKDISKGGQAIEKAAK